MSDIRAGKGSALGDDDRLPWLEAVDEDDSSDGPSVGKLIAFVLIGLVAIGLIVGGLFWMGSRTGDSADIPEGGELIAAPAEDYKVKPDQPGGMEVEGKGDTAFAASAGQEPKGKINMGAMPEEPVTAAPGTPAAQPKAAQAKAGREIEVAVASSPARPAPAPAQRPAPAAQAPAPAMSGAGVQLGAFSSQASAEKAWKNLSGRFAYLAPLNHGVVAVQSGGKTLYRLRASGGDTKSICSRLRIAGESCVEVN